MEDIDWKCERNKSSKIVKNCNNELMFWIFDFLIIGVMSGDYKPSESVCVDTECAMLMVLGTQTTNSRE